MRAARRKLLFTREGKYFVALTIALGLAAVNTGNNLLHLVVGMMLALIIGSGVLSELSLHAITIKRRAPDRIYAGRPFLMGIELRNGKRRCASFSLEIEDQLASLPLHKKCYFLKLPAGHAQHTCYRHAFERRGRYCFSGFQISTKFPFGLFRKSRVAPCAGEVIVFPAVFPLALPMGGSGTSGEQLAGRPDRQGEFYALRDYVAGDDPRAISWRKSAQLGHLVIREHEQQLGRRVAIFLDNHEPQAPISVEERAAQERAVSHAASLAAHYIEQGYAVRLATRSASVAEGTGQSHLTQILRVLALLEFTSEERPFIAPARWSGECIFVGPPAGSTGRQPSAG